MTFSFNLDIDDLSLAVNVGLISHLLIVKINGFENPITFGQKCLLFIYFYYRRSLWIYLFNEIVPRVILELRRFTSVAQVDWL